MHLEAAASRAAQNTVQPVAECVQAVFYPTSAVYRFIFVITLKYPNLLRVILPYSTMLMLPAVALLLGKKRKKAFIISFAVIMLSPWLLLFIAGEVSNAMEAEMAQRAHAARLDGAIDDCGCIVREEAEKHRLAKTKPAECLGNQIEQVF